MNLNIVLKKINYLATVSAIKYIYLFLFQLSPYIAGLSAVVAPCQGMRIEYMHLHPYFDPFAGFSMFYPIFF